MDPTSFSSHQDTHSQSHTNATNALPQRQQCKSYIHALHRCTRALLTRALRARRRRAIRVRLEHQVALRVARDARPPRLEALLARVEARERMRLGIQHDLIERQDVAGSEEEVEVL